MSTFIDPRLMEAIYKTVKIGDQIWMAENLKVEAIIAMGILYLRYIIKKEWGNLTTGGWCHYENDHQK